MNYWLIKSEPGVYSIDNLREDGSTCWDGVRNYQARNFMRDIMRVGDLVLFYHSNTDPPAVVGVARVCREAYSDHMALDPNDPHYDPASTVVNPIWMMVDVEFVEKFANPVSLAALKSDPALDGLLVIRRASRLSVMPVSQAHFEHIVGLGRNYGNAEKF